MRITKEEGRKAARDALIRASTTFRPDQIEAYRRSVASEGDEKARWVLETILQNAEAAESGKLPLCDDTGIPHVFFEVGDEVELGGDVLVGLSEGVADGLRDLPGRPMAVRGGDRERLGQTSGLFTESEALLPAPINIRSIRGSQARVTVLMLGGGPEIRAKTLRVFHHRQWEKVIGEAASWAAQASRELGCTPCVPAIGIGRTHYEATSLMVEAMKDGDLGVQSELEEMVTAAVNGAGTGPLGLGGKATALGSFVKVGPQRASGVRIVAMRIGCCFEPRKATVVLG